MNKLQKAEFISLILGVIFFLFTMVQSLKDFNLFETSGTSLSVFIGFVATVISVLIFLVIYIINSIKESTKLRMCLRFIFPALFVIYSCVNINGIWSFNKEFVAENILSLVWGILTIIFYNMYILFYQGRECKSIISLILYNIVVWVLAITTGNHIKYIVNYYLVFLCFAILGTWLEFIIKTKRGKKSCFRK